MYSLDPTLQTSWCRGRCMWCPAAKMFCCLDAGLRLMLPSRHLARQVRCRCVFFQKESMFVFVEFIFKWSKSLKTYRVREGELGSFVHAEEGNCKNTALSITPGKGNWKNTACSITPGERELEKHSMWEDLCNMVCWRYMVGFIIHFYGVLTGFAIF